MNTYRAKGGVIIDKNNFILLYYLCQWDMRQPQ